MQELAEARETIKHFATLRFTTDGQPDKGLVGIKRVKA